MLVIISLRFQNRDSTINFSNLQGFFYLGFIFFICNLFIFIHPNLSSRPKQFFNLMSLKLTFMYFHLIYFARILHFDEVYHCFLSFRNISWWGFHKNWRQWRLSDVFIVNFKQTTHIVLMFPLWLWPIKFQPGNYVFSITTQCFKCKLQWPKVCN